VSLRAKGGRSHGTQIRIGRSQPQPTQLLTMLLQREGLDFYPIWLARWMPFTFEFIRFRGASVQLAGYGERLIGGRLLEFPSGTVTPLVETAEEIQPRRSGLRARA
jgi:hypothetical protein